ncbi:MAG: hypothetical protein EOO88_01985 [Pedobacter sp.]|nr:MAG: hypothetical protein EOO88_01985 [Pedobacter sp.]
MRRNNFIERMGKGKYVFIPLMVFSVMALFTYVVMLLWNNILPDVIHVESITFWQSAGIIVLCKLLFGFGRMGGPGGRGAFRKRQLAEKMKSMSPEELERFKERMGDHKFGRFRNWCRDENEEGK